jgi:predicted DNA-binding transcriptional regulator YafY
LHGSQKVTAVSDDLLEVKLKIIINYELESLILSFGENVKVIQPITLRTRIEERLRLAIDKYSI